MQKLVRRNLIGCLYDFALNVVGDVINVPEYMNERGLMEVIKSREVACVFVASLVFTLPTNPYVEYIRNPVVKNVYNLYKFSPCLTIFLVYLEMKL